MTTRVTGYLRARKQFDVCALLSKRVQILTRIRGANRDDSKAQFKCLMLSLDGLLDYTLDDDMEKNFEVPPSAYVGA
jgi:hypothetical protein